jgi:hypothetical protein
LKKLPKKKLVLDRDVIRLLKGELRAVEGGVRPGCSGESTCDTVDG